MIELTPSTALLLYFAFTLIPLFAIWAYHHFHIRQKEILPQENKLWVCEYCQFVYLGSPAVKVTKCPQCHSFNKT